MRSFRIFLSTVFLLLFTFISHADVTRVVETMASTDSLTSILVPQGTVAYTKSFSLNNQLFAPVGIMYKATSSGTITLSLQAEQSYKRPTVEAIPDVTFVQWKAPITISDDGWHAATFDTVIMPFGRFKVTGSGSNDATTVIQIKVGK